MKFHEIISPVNLHDFLQTTWGSNTLLIKGDVEKFTLFPEISEIPALVAGTIENSSWINTRNLKAQAYRLLKNGLEETFQNVPIEMYTQLFNSGYGLCFDDVSSSHPELNDLVLDIGQNEFAGSGISVTCYLTPPNSHGLLHFDHQHVFFMQVEGEKNWRISERPAIKNPVSNLVYPKTTKEFLTSMEAMGYKINTPADSGYSDVTLSKGGLLYLPPGFYHVGHTNDLPSLHYTLTLEPVSTKDAIFSFLSQKFWAHSIQLNEDLRFKTEEGRKLSITSNVDLTKMIINSLTAEEINSHIKNEVDCP